MSVISVMSELQIELKQTKPWKSKEEELYLNLARTAEALSWKVSELLKSYELTGVQYNVLRILRGAGGDGLICSEISERLITKDSDITRLLERLENRGLIRRERSEKDRRIVIARITDAGLNLLAAIDEPIIELHRRQLGHLGESLLDQLNALLVLARSNIS
ncbi:MAG: MarR family transcriptional regulator [Acidobacteriota bacterium]|nr:MarR family transcriptional regulator [Acidobacteriota bacterium]